MFWEKMTHRKQTDAAARIATRPLESRLPRGEARRRPPPGTRLVEQRPPSPLQHAAGAVLASQPTSLPRPDLAPGSPHGRESEEQEGGMWGARVEGAGGGRGRRRVLAVFWEEADRRDGRERQYEPRVGGHGGWGSPPLDLLQGRGRAQARAVEAGGPSLRRAAAASTPRATTAFADRAGPLCRARNHLRPARPGAAAAPPAAAMRAEGRREEGGGGGGAWPPAQRGDRGGAHPAARSPSHHGSAVGRPPQGRLRMSDAKGKVTPPREEEGLAAELEPVGRRPRRIHSREKRICAGADPRGGGGVGGGGGDGERDRDEPRGRRGVEESCGRRRRRRGSSGRAMAAAAVAPWTPPAPPSEEGGGRRKRVFFFATVKREEERGERFFNRGLRVGFEKQ